MILTRLLRKLINIITVEDTYFVFVQKPQNVKLSKEAIFLNYKHLSPFKNGDLIYLQTKNSIFIWFTKNKLSNKNKVYIPEGYLIYKSLKTKKEAIGITEKTKDTYILSVIKNNLLLSQIIVKNSNLNQKILFLTKEYSLKNPEKIDIPISKLNLSFTDILLFSNFSFKKEELYKSTLKTISLPISIFVILQTIFFFLMSQHLEEKIKEKTDYLNKLKEQTKDTKKLLYLLEEKKQFWETFLKTEKKYPSIYYVLNEIAKVISSKNGYINSLEFNENVITLWAGLKAGDTSLVNDLLKTGVFKEVKIISSVKDRHKDNYEIINMEIYLKEKR
ncbi:MAG TPA: hypothetical protein EYH43_06625 [Persephonella sp.]|nr:hypothetical protein [Hydrogenothermaceae bacterium]HIQ25636.1 hypothetical protein [Persephonella sp.]